jgi:hypothetical protein
MAIRIKRASMVWLAIAAVMFALSFVFTAMVTWVGHEEPFEKASKPEGRPVQLVSVFRMTPKGNQPYMTSFVANPRGGVDMIEISVFAEDSPVILVNNLVNAKSCVMLDRGAPQNEKPRNNDGRLSVQAFHSDITNQRIYRLTPRFGSLDRGIHDIRCKIRSTVKYETFTDRGVELNAYDPFHPLVCARPLAPNAPDCDRELLDGLEPKMLSAFVDLNFSRMRGIENLHYSGGYEDQHAEGREYDRGLANGRVMFVYWEDVYRQQLRDTLLIVIGTLIGIGVTVLIEGIRPYLESLGEKNGGPPESSPGSPQDKPPEPKQKIELPSFRPTP